MQKFIMLLLLVFISGSALAAPTTYYFNQSGFDEGAIVTGSFTGEDLDNNGQLVSGGEIFDFEMSFSGNSIVPAFSLGFGDLYGLVYDLDGGPLGDGLSLAIEGIGAIGGPYTYVVGPGPFSECGQGVDCARVSEGESSDFSQELVQVTEITAGSLNPVPLSPGMLIILALLLVSVGWRYVKE